ncbi:MAG: hypothetical protein V4546_05475 [Bacteroidota bacterium]
MKQLIIFLLILLGVVREGSAQVNVELLHQLVSESKSEHSRQNDAKNKQMVTTANEEVNRSEMGKLKAKYRELQSRFQTLGLAIDAVQIGLQASPVITEIIRQQGLIFQLAGNDPLLITLAYNAEIDMADQAYLLSNYMYGLSISVGDLNQMKASDRKILFGHIVTELQRIAGASRGLAAAMSYASRKKALQSLNPFGDFINEDKRLIDDILRKADILKNP